MVTHKLELPNFHVHQSCIGKACSSSALVHSGKYKSEENTAAIRCIPLEDSKVPLHEIQNEIRLMKLCRHKNILPLLDTFVHNETLCIVTPFMDYGSVSDILGSKYNLGIPELAVSQILIEVLNAIVYLHSRDIIHRGIRCSHILLNSNGDVKLNGFRYSISGLKDWKKVQKIHEFSPSLKNNLLWLAPEVLQQNLYGYDKKSDLYSLGIAVCEMANGFPPFADMEPMQMLLEKLGGTTPRLLDSSSYAQDGEVGEVNERGKRKFSAVFHTFAETCLRPNPHQRPEAKDLLGHPFLKIGKKSKQSLTDILGPISIQNNLK